MRISVVLGTRPEVIKLAPVIHELGRRGCQTQVIHTGQHTSLAEDLYRFFEIDLTVNLHVMLEKPNLNRLTERIIGRLEDSGLARESDWILVQGDTTSAFAGAYWGFCNRIPVAHIEAGLRTFNLSSPFPEEGNRQLIGRIASEHFAPTSAAAQNLRREGIDPSSIHIVGNTSIDALHYALERIHSGTVTASDRLNPEVANFIGDRKFVLVTAHRRENVGQPLARICEALLELARLRPDLCFVLPVHPNPHIRGQITEALASHPRILCCEPQGYIAFSELMSRADLILTDSGGVQEEAPSLNKPILVLRESTERPEGVAAGFAKLVGSDKDLIVTEALLALEHGAVLKGPNPYGDGRAAQRIANVLLERHQLSCDRLAAEQSSR